MEPGGALPPSHVADDCEPPRGLLLHVLVGEFASDGCECSDSCDMDGDIWSRLPEELLLAVLRLLPRRSKHRFRTVSQQWYSLLSSPRLLEGFHSGLPRLCGLQYLTSRDTGASQSQQGERNERAKTVQLDLSYLPSRFLGWEMIAGGEVGLVVMTNMQSFFHSAHRKFCVLNPMTRTWKELPCIGSPNLLLLLKLLVERDPSGTGFRLCAVCSQRSRVRDESRPLVALYHSVSNEWQVSEVESPLCEQVVMRGNLLYHVSDWDEDQSGFLTVFRLEDGKLVREDDLDLPEPPAQGNFLVVSAMSYLVNHCDDVYLVLEVVRDASVTVEVWKLILHSRTWCYLSTLQLTKDDGVSCWLDGITVFSIDKYIYVSSPERLCAFSIDENTWDSSEFRERSATLFYIQPSLDLFV